MESGHYHWTGQIPTAAATEEPAVAEPPIVLGLKRAAVVDLSPTAAVAEEPAAVVEAASSALT